MNRLTQEEVTNIIRKKLGEDYIQKSPYINKRNLALSNGIEKYIIIDCYHTNLKYIKNSILNSELVQILNFNNLDWSLCDRKACSSKMKSVCMDYNKGISSIELQEKYNICEETVRRYIQRAKINGLIMA